MAYYIYGRIMHRDTSTTVDKINGQQAVGKAPGPMLKADYFDSMTPRVDGLYHTAPRYDELTEPTDAPWPMACIENHKTDTCRCLDQQGNKYQTTLSKCRQIVAGGIFKDWGQLSKPSQAQGRPEARHEQPGVPALSWAEPSAK
ncbi:MAG: hypothetical protein Q8N89_02375 [Azonexus sp.]|nr:hypothetical protein [Azonexus sp.]